MSETVGLEAITPRVRYRDYRERLQEIHAYKWFIYHRGHIGAARRANREIELIARISYGLHLAGKAVLAQKRNAEGVMEYMIFPLGKVLLEDMDEAMALTSEKKVRLTGRA